MKFLSLMVVLLILCGCNLSAPGAAVGLATPSALPDAPDPSSMSNLPTPDYATPAAAQTDWVTYRSTRYPYQLQHPRDMLAVEDRQSGRVVINDQITIDVWDRNPEEAFGDGPIIEEARDVMIWRYPARSLKGSIGSIGGNIPQSYEQVVIPHAGRFYRVTVYELRLSTPLTAENGTRSPGPIAEDTLALFNSILTTFQFTDEGAS